MKLTLFEPSVMKPTILLAPFSVRQMLFTLRWRLVNESVSMLTSCTGDNVHDPGDAHREGVRTRQLANRSTHVSRYALFEKLTTDGVTVLKYPFRSGRPQKKHFQLVSAPGSLLTTALVAQAVLGPGRPLPLHVPYLEGQARNVST